MMTRDAARWALRRKAGPLPATEQRQFDAWLAGDERREGELLQADAMLALIDRAQAVVVPEAAAPATISRRHAIGWGSAAVAAGAAGLWLLPHGDTLSTRIGQIRRSRLPDTSSVTLNTQSRVTVRLEQRERRVSLDRGEAWFQVAHDRTRPFVVSAADARIQAIGTAFSVRRLAGGVDVLVTEGRVEVWRAHEPWQRVAVTKGRRAFVPDDGVAIVPVREDAGIERALAWRSGHLALAGESLDYAVSEINRYNDVQIRVDDPGLGRSAVIGYFDVGNPIGFAQLIAGLKNARVETDAGIVRLIPNRT